MFHALAGKESFHAQVAKASQRKNQNWHTACMIATECACIALGLPHGRDTLNPGKADFTKHETDILISEKYEQVYKAAFKAALIQAELHG